MGAFLFIARFIETLRLWSALRESTVCISTLGRQPSCVVIIHRSTVHTHRPKDLQLTAPCHPLINKSFAYPLHGDVRKTPAWGILVS